MEKIEIRIIETRNGFLIKKITFTDIVCADNEELWTANEAKEVSEIVYNLLPKG